MGGTVRLLIVLVWTTAFSLHCAGVGDANAVVPKLGVTPAFVPLAIDAGPGDQQEARVRGDVAVYGAADLSIHYFNFATLTGSAIPVGNSVQDLLVSTDGSRITFARVRNDGTQNIELFDIASQSIAEIDPRPAPTSRSSPVLAGNTLAYIDQTESLLGELVVHDLTTNTSVQLTHDGEIDQNPSISPDGSMVFWEHCPTFPNLCDIWQARRNGSAWTVSVVSADPADEAFPATDGVIVAYSADRPAGAGDIFYRPVGGGPEVQIELPGLQALPRVAGHFISFVSSAPSGIYQLFVYDTSSNTLFQVTDDTNGTVDLQDITVLPDGSVRLVWSQFGQLGTGFDVYSATFKLPADHCPGTLFSPAPASPYAAGLQPSAVATGDFNGDGKLDLAVADAASGKVSILLGDGAGSFGAAVDYPATGAPNGAGSSNHVGPDLNGAGHLAMAVGDFNGDGKLDLVVASADSTSIAILLGKGDGGFWPATRFDVSGNPYSVVTADLDGDGKLDLALTVASASASAVAILRGNGDGSFGPATLQAAGWLPLAVAVGDFNQDGIPDLAVANAGDSTVSILLGVGNASFLPATDLPLAAGSLPLAIAVGDFNGDGRPDLAIADYGSNSVSLLLANGPGTFAPAASAPVGVHPSSIAIGDFDGDGLADIAVTDSANGTAAPGDVWVMPGDGRGGFHIAVGTPFAVGSKPVSLAVGDFNGDGNPDLAVALANDNAAALLLCGCLPTSPATRPVIAAHPDITAEATSAGGAVVDYVSPLTSDPVDGPGLASCTPAPGAQFPLGNTSVICRAVDTRGNPALSTNFLVHVVDTTPPVISYRPSPAPNGNGWNNTSVTVSFSAVDLVGTASCNPASSLVTAEGANQAVSSTCSDWRGNSTTGSLLVSIDKTPPSVGVTLAPVRSKAGTLTGIQVSYACSDALSGIASCPAPATLNFASGFLASWTQALAASAKDRAGNTNSAACGLVSQFVNLVNAASGHSLSPAQAAALLAIARQYKTTFHCN